MQPAEELRYLVLAAQREGNRMLARELRPLGLTPSQAEVLRVLDDHQPLTLRGLGELLVCETTTNPSRLVDRLVATGTITRQPGRRDRRQIDLTLTPRGKRLAQQVKTVERRLYRTLETATAGQNLDGVLTVLRSFVADQPAGKALQRRIEWSRETTT